MELTKISASLIAAFGSGLLFATTSTVAQEAQRVEITGSAIKRVDAETALPVQVMNREDIKRTGAVNVEQLVQTISAASSNGNQVGSSASGATTGGISSISLRGLTSLRTLVLLNGKRLAPYGMGFTNDSVSVDISSIPIAAVERVEILKDGASSLYGSDAIAGVVNFILRKDFAGLELGAEYGIPTKGSKGDTKRASLAWGLGNVDSDKYNVMIVATLQKESSLFGRDRSFARTSINEKELNDTSSGNTFPANIAAVDGSFGSRNPTAATGCVAPYSTIDPLFGTKTCRFDPASLVALLPDVERVGLMGSAKFVLSENLEAYIDASYSKSKQTTVIQPVPISDQFTLPSTNPLANQAPYNIYTPKPSSTIILSPTSPFYPTSYVQGLTGGPTPDLFVRYRAAVSGNRNITDYSDAPRLNFGLRGTAAGWDFDSSFLYSSSRVRERVNDGYPQYTKILPLLNSGTVNFFGDNSPAVVDQLRAANFTGDALKVTSTLMSLGGTVSREVARTAGGPVGLAVGVELRKEKWSYNPSIELQQGDVSGYGGNQAKVDKSRSVKSVFSEINVPIIKGLEVNGGIRFDDYEGVGNSTTPKVSMRWQPVSQVLFRGSIARGFRAPSLADLYAPNTEGVTQTGLTDPQRCPTTNDGIRDCSTQFSVINGGNSKLKPEKSTNYTLGIVLEPIADLSIAVDAFKIRLSDTITQGLPQTFILANLDKFSSFVTRGPVDPAFPTLPGPIISIDQTNINLGQSRLSGFDFDLRYKFRTENWGRFLLNMTGTYFAKYDTQNPDGSFSTQVGNLNNATTGGVIPRWKTYQSVTWELGDWATTLAMAWQSSYIDLVGSFMDPADPSTYRVRRVGNYKTYDAQTTYSGIKNLRLTLGVKNLFNQRPPYTNQGFSFQSGYDPQYVDPRGRFIYVGVNYAFK